MATAQASRKRPTSQRAHLVEGYQAERLLGRHGSEQLRAASVFAISPEQHIQIIGDTMLACIPVSGCPVW